MSSRVALLSNGEEEIKGNQAVQEAHALLKQRAAKTGMNFIGNVEGKDVAAHLADVIVADGFVGNIALKTAEGIAKMLNGFDPFRNQSESHFHRRRRACDARL